MPANSSRRWELIVQSAAAAVLCSHVALPQSYHATGLLAQKITTPLVSLQKGTTPPVFSSRHAPGARLFSSVLPAAGWPGQGLGCGGCRAAGSLCFPRFGALPLVEHHCRPRRPRTSFGCKQQRIQKRRVRLAAAWAVVSLRSSLSSQHLPLRYAATGCRGCRVTPCSQKRHLVNLSSPVMRPDVCSVSLHNHPPTFGNLRTVLCREHATPQIVVEEVKTGVPEALGCQDRRPPEDQHGIQALPARRLEHPCRWRLELSDQMLMVYKSARFNSDRRQRCRSDQNQEQTEE